jgi:hypothetical protein
MAAFASGTRAGRHPVEPQHEVAPATPVPRDAEQRAVAPKPFVVHPEPHNTSDSDQRDREIP